jgi:hypothetical protein
LIPYSCHTLAHSPSRCHGTLLLQLLVREPYGVVQSFSKVIQPSLLELGYGVGASSSSSSKE